MLLVTIKNCILCLTFLILFKSLGVVNKTDGQLILIGQAIGHKINNL